MNNSLPPLLRMSAAEFQADLDQRIENMCKILEIEVDYTERVMEKYSYMVELPLSVTDVYDETNAALGQTWLWSFRKYYFARESDAVWFAMRFL